MRLQPVRFHVQSIYAALGPWQNCGGGVVRRIDLPLRQISDAQSKVLALKIQTGREKPVTLGNFPGAKDFAATLRRHLKEI